MPVINDSMPVVLPKPGTTICRYIDVTKFLALLSTNALFFCRVDKLEDYFEGRTAQGNFMIRYLAHKWDITYSSLSDEEIYAKVQELYDFDEQVREVACVSCWNKFTHESAALWKIYSDFGKGIMIKSSVERLNEAFLNTPETIRVSEVKYMDYKTGRMPDFNTVFPIIHKQEAYGYEQEIRYIHFVDDAQIGKTFDWKSQPLQNGILLNLDVNELIDEIILAPDSTNWFKSILEDICLKYGLNKKISKSVLSVR